MKNKKIFKIVGIICTIVIIFELGYMLINKIITNYKINYEDNINNILYNEDKSYVIVGTSNFANSKNIKKRIISHTDSFTNTSGKIYASMSRIAKYDNSSKLVWENTYDCKYNSVYYDIIQNDIGYLVVGGYAKDQTASNENTLTGIIVQYDFNGNFIKSIEYKVLTDTFFTKIIKSGDNYIVVGSSIYENFEIGNHYTGGGIIVKLNSNLEIIESNNYGGNKSGIFYDVIEVDDGYLVCGKDASNYGILVKFKKNFNREENDIKNISNKVLLYKSYDYVLNGFTDMDIIDNKIYLVGAISTKVENVDDKLDVTYDPGIIITDFNGKKLNTININSSENFDAFNRITHDEENIYVIGNIISKDFNNEKINKNYDQAGILMVFDYNRNTKYDIIFGDRNTTVFNNILLSYNNLIIVGTSNSEEHFKDKDYSPLLIKENLDLRQTLNEK